MGTADECYVGRGHFAVEAIERIGGIYQKCSLAVVIRKG